MGKAIGIDLGTTNSVVAFKDTNVKIVQTGVNNEDLCRSCVVYDDKNDQFLVGNSVYNNWKKYDPNIVVSVKRLMGVAFTDNQVQKMIKDKKSYPFGITKPTGGTDDAVAVVLKGREFSPEQISAEILRALKNDANVKLGGDVTHAVITVPAYFTEKQKTATMDAARLAGINVQQLLAEPTAAAISYGFDKLNPGETKNLLVYDFGGGTFDLSILTAGNNQFIESGSGGDRWLGGDDIDRILSDYVCKEIEKRDNFVLEDLLKTKSDKESAAFKGGLKSDVESAKKMLSQVEKATISFSNYLENENFDPVDDFVITREKFNELIRPLIQRTIDLIEELSQKINYPIDVIDNILLVGGSSCIPLVREMLINKYGNEKVKFSDRPMLAVAEGAAILAQQLPADEQALEETKVSSENNDSLVITTTKHELHIQVVGGYQKLVDIGEPLPLSISKKFKTSCDNQKIVEVGIYNDAEGGKLEKISTGYFTISENLPSDSDISFTFDLDVNEILSVKVKLDKSTYNVRLSRGKCDDRALGVMKVNIDGILQDGGISSGEKLSFIDEIQGIIDDINKNEKDYAPEANDKWQEVETKVLQVRTRALMSEKQDNDFGKTLALVLLNEYPQYLKHEDAISLQNDLQALGTTTDILQKQGLMQSLENTARNYDLLTTIFVFKLVGQQTNDPRVAARANAVYDEMILNLNNGNVPAVLELINNNVDLVQSQGTSINIGMGTGIK